MITNIHDILTSLENNVAYDVQKRVTQNTNDVSPKQKHNEAYRQIKSLISIELIGYDELATPKTTILENAVLSERNKLRAELRERLNRL